MLVYAFKNLVFSLSAPLFYSMKFKLSLIVFIAISIQAFAQSKNTVAFVYGFANANVDINGAIGDFGYERKTGTNFGLTYSKHITSLLSLQTGLIYADDKAEENSILPGRSGIYDDGDLKIISVPIIAKLTFFKYVYADGGISIDKEINYAGNYLQLDQSGIGFEAGVGGQYTFSHLTVFVNPYIKGYGLVHFNSKEQFNLLEDGFKFGLGYNF
jgi:hypothetical protein